MLKFSTIYIFLKQCCSIFGIKVHICSWKELLCNNIWNGVQRFYDQRNIYKCILYYQVYWLQFYLLCIYIHVPRFVLMFWFYFAFDFTRNYGIHVFIYSIYIYLGLESILRKLFWESFCCSFELGPPYCLAFVTSQHLICHIWPSLYLLFVLSQ